MKLILVGGMHRSGTSFIAELIHVMGAATGDELLEAAPDNPHGFFEHTGVKQINDAVLNHLGATWDRPARGITRTWHASQGLDGLRQRAEETIEKLMSSSEGAPACVIKDPRLSLTAPFWRSLVEIDAAVVALRDPLEVAQSLRHRNGMSQERAAALWIRYTIEALLELPNGHVAPLSRLQAEPADAIERLASHIDVDGADVGAAVERASGRDRTWAPNDVFTSDVGGSQMRLARSLYHVLLADVSPDDLRPVLSEFADQWRASPLVDMRQLHQTDPDEALAGAIEVAVDRAERLEQRLQDAEIMLVETRAERDQAKREARATKADLDRTTAEAQRAAAEAKSQLEQANRIRTEQQTRAEHAEGEAKRFESMVTARDEQLRAADARRADVEGKATSLTTEVQRLRSVSDETALRARAAERNFDRLKSRRLVRVALGVARPFGPMIRLGRRARRPRSQPGGGNRQRSEGDSGAGLAATRSPDEARLGTRSYATIVDRLLAAPPVTVVVPVYNAPRDVERCLERLVAHTHRVHDILVIDDASTDPEVAEILSRFDGEPGLRIIRNEANLGFTRTVNKGFESTSGDVVILNSDARVTPNWLVNLRAAAYSADRVASASAVSDNAGAFSVPEPGENPSAGIDEEPYARLFLQSSIRRWVQSPTGHGFCMYLRRAALDDVGIFDAAEFPRGYGEENDWSRRAAKAGWSHVIDDATIVFHANAASFDPASKQQLVTTARATIDRLHPEYTTEVRSFLSGDMQDVRRDARAVHAAARSMARAGGAEATVRPRLLSVVQEGGGGTPKTNLDLMTALQDHWDPWILRSNGERLELVHVVGDTTEIVETAKPSASLGANRPTDAAYREFVSRIVISMGFEMVHVRHLFKHSQTDVPDIVRALGLPSVLSFHDYYWVCPNVNLVDETGTFCGGVCTATPGDCDLPVPGAPVPVRLKDNWVHTWRSSATDLFAGFDEFVTTSNTARDMMYRHLPALEARRITVIPHGRDLEQLAGVTQPPDPGRITIAVIGLLSGPKGGHFLRELLAADTDHLLDVHIVGTSQPEFDDLRCTFHGAYQRDGLGDVLAAIRPSFGALLSIWPETWSHTLTEAWAMGLPVLVSQDGGALCERVEEHGGGWVIDTSDPAGSLERIVAIANDVGEWRVGADGATIAHLSTTADMATRYEAVYTLAGDRSRPSKPVVATHVVRSVDGTSPGSAHVRTIRRMCHPDVARELIIDDVSSTGPTARPKHGIADVIWVQRNAVEPPAIDELLADRERTGARLIVDLDDDLVHADGLPRQFGQYVPHMRRLLEAADLTTVSTAPLAEVVRPWASSIEILPNQIDDTLWFSGGVEASRKAEDGTVDVLYMGTATHGDDLALIEEPFRRFAEARHARLWVVGGAPPSDDEWFERIEVPDDAKEYPRFVPWLRSIANRFDFAIAPLVENDFNDSKSDLKFLEYAALGLPAIFSRRPAYENTVTHDVDGILVDNTPDDWENALTQLSRRAEQERLRRAAHDTVQGRTISATAERFVALIENVLPSPRPTSADRSI